jgi:hypothetical protein
VLWPKPEFLILFFCLHGLNTFSQTFNLDSLTNKVPDLAEFILYSYLPKENFFLALTLIPAIII